MLKIEDYKVNGAAWPFELSRQFPGNYLEREYREFQASATKILGSKVSIKPNLLSTFFDGLAFDKGVIEKVREVIGPDIYIWSSAFFYKASKDKKIVSFHQDNPYWQLTSDKVVTAWIALTKSDEISGAMQIVPQSHRKGVIKDLDIENPREAYLKGIKTTPDIDLLSYNNDLDAYIEINKPITICLSPGQFSLHHVNTVHGSGTNNSFNDRVGFAVRYVSSDTKHKMEEKDTALHVCGKKNPYFDDEVRPKSDFDNSAIACYKNSLKSTGAFGNKKYG